MGQYDVPLHVENRRMDGLSTYHSRASTITLCLLMSTTRLLPTGW